MPRRDVRPWVYAALDGLFALLYLWIPSLFQASDRSFHLFSAGLALALAVAGAGTAARRSWGWWMGIGGCVALIVGALTLLALLVSSAAFLWGVYGALGRGASLGALVLTLLVVELYLLLPAFQLKYLLSADGRRAAGRSVRAVRAEA